MATTEGRDVRGGSAVCRLPGCLWCVCVCLCSAWSFIMQNFRKKGSLLVTVPSLHESLKRLQVKDTPVYAHQENIP